jgi:hypothetical protein
MKRVKKMKAKINIEIFDDSTLKKSEELGFYPKTLETLYTVAFETLLKEICTGTGADYTLSVEIVDNTTN